MPTNTITARGARIRAEARRTMSQAATPASKAIGGSHDTGAKAPRAEGAPTQVSRATGMALTKVLANEFARDNILVNALLTGSIVTDQVANRYKREQPALSFEDYIANIGNGIPIGRMGTAQEYANLACFLASEAGSYVTGTAINLDGGACPVV